MLREKTVDPISAFRWSTYGDGLSHVLGDPHFHSEAEARRAWQKVRRQMWDERAGNRIPDTAKVYDGLTEDGRDLLFSTWNHVTVPLEDILEALASDRERLARFRATPAGASIADHLDAVLARWQRLEDCARAIAPIVYYRRPYPKEVL
jgi:hypothetical protein